MYTLSLVGRSVTARPNHLSLPSGVETTLHSAILDLFRSKWPQIGKTQADEHSKDYYEGLRIPFLLRHIS